MAEMPRGALEQLAESLLSVPPNRRDDKWYDNVKSLIPELVPERIDTLAQLASFITTPLFKYLFGFEFGWKDGQAEGAVTGHIGEDGKKSSDGWVTVDLEIRDIEIAGHNGHVIREEDKALIRIEFRKSLVKDMGGKDAVPRKKCTWITVRGELKFDRDGHFEIHPRHPEDITVHGHTPPPRPGEPASGGRTGSSEGGTTPAPGGSQAPRRPEDMTIHDHIPRPRLGEPASGGKVGSSEGGTTPAPGGPRNRGGDM